jgi:hypothetical protein
MLGKGAEARPLLQATLNGFERLGLPDGTGWCHDHLGWAALLEGDCDRARDHKVTRRSLSTPTGSNHCAAVWLASLAA